MMNLEIPFCSGIFSDSNKYKGKYCQCEDCRPIDFCIPDEGRGCTECDGPVVNCEKYTG